MRCIRCFVCSLLWVGALCAGTLETADKLFEEHKYDQALVLYDSIAKKRLRDELQLKALYRAAESEVLLFRYAEANARLAAFDLPKTPLWKIRFLILKTELAREYLKQYARAVPQDSKRGSRDVIERPKGEWHRVIGESYAGLWELRLQASRRLLNEEGYFVDVSDTLHQPTLWDFVTLRWTSYLSDEAEDKGLRPDGVAFLNEQSQPRLKELSKEWAKERAKQISALYETAAGSATPHPLAKETWRLKRALLAAQHPHLFSSATDRKAVASRTVAMLLALAKTSSQAEIKSIATMESAHLLLELDKFGEAEKQCDAVVIRWPKTLAYQQCRDLLSNVRSPKLAISGLPSIPGKSGSLSLVVRNLNEVSLRLYPTTLAELKLASRSIPTVDWSYVRHLHAEALQTILKSRPISQWTVPVRTVHAHESQETVVSTPAPLSPGLYVAVASGDKEFSPGNSVLAGTVLQVSSLILFGSSGVEEENPRWGSTQVGFRAYAIDAETGAPVSALAVQNSLRENWQKVTQHTITTDGQGIARIPVAWEKGRSYTADSLADHRGSIALWETELPLTPIVPPALQGFVETDRPIYRPGDSVKVKFTLLKQSGHEVTLAESGTELEMVLRDASGEEVSKKKAALGSMGTVAGEFEIPTGRLMGRYTVQVRKPADGNADVWSAGFDVEQYRVPTFEVGIHEAEGAWKYAKQAKVSGNVRYYTGGQVPEADVEYRIHRETYVPWFCWWWNPGRRPGNRVEVAQGRVRSNAQGVFEFTFVPEPEDVQEKSPAPAKFTVTVEAREKSGRVIASQKTFTAGSHALLFEIDRPQRFVMADARPHLNVRTLNLSEQPISEKVTYEVLRLGDPKGKEFAAARLQVEDNPSLEDLFRDAPIKESVGKGSFTTTGKELALNGVELPQLPAGVYRIVLSVRDVDGKAIQQSLVLPVVSSTFATGANRLPSVALSEIAQYSVGSTARVLVGSTELKGKLFIEIWIGTRLHKVELLPAGLQLYTFAVTEQMRGGVEVRWLGASSYTVRMGQTHVEIPWSSKNLTMAVTKLLPRVTPGTKVPLEVTVKNEKSEPVDAEVTLRVYDRALEYYSKLIPPWVETLYPPNRNPDHPAFSVMNRFSTELYVPIEFMEKRLGIPPRLDRVPPEPAPPSLRSSQTRLYGYYGAVRKGVRMMHAPMAEAMRGNVDTGNAGAAEEAPPSRSQFAATALFVPQLEIKQGVGSVEVPFPEQLTSWRISGYALTRNLERGTVSLETVTAKDLMVRLDVPRFYREGDRGELQVLVENRTDATLTGDLELAIGEGEKDLMAELKIGDRLRKVTVAGNSIQSERWTIQIPNRVLLAKMRATVRMGKLIDGEVREVPILPSRERVLASSVQAFQGTQTKTLSLGTIPAGSQIEAAFLRVEPQLLLPILNSLPQLQDSPCDSVDHLLNRYLPMAVVSKLFEKYPNLKKAALKLPERKGVTVAWEKDDPRRLLSIQETPWSGVSRGLEMTGSVVRLTDADAVESLSKKTLDELRKAQLPDGGFPWFRGGKSDRFTTLYVLKTFAEAAEFGVPIPEDIVRNAFQFVTLEHAKEGESVEGRFQLDLLTGYTLSYYVSAYPWAAPAKGYLEETLSKATRLSRALTPMGKAYVAYIYRRLGKEALSDDFLERAMAGVKLDEVTGLFWTPEKISWFWYNDSVEKHAFFLRTLLKWKPKDERIAGLARWLLFNRKGSQWKSARAASAAVFTLVSFYETQGAMTIGEQLSIQWDSTTVGLSMGPNEFSSQPLQWQLKEFSGDRIPAATVEKRGPTLAFASLTALFSAEPSVEAQGDLLRVERSYYVRKRAKEGGYQLIPLAPGVRVQIGDEVEVQLKISARSQFEYVSLRVPTPSGFEPEKLKSGWEWDQIGRYEEVRDSLVNLYFDWLPHGEYTLRYRLRPTKAGTFRVGPARLQSVYSPDVGGYSSGAELRVVN